MKVKIVTDSSIQLTANERQQAQLTIIPLDVGFGKNLNPETDIDRADFFKEMQQHTELPTTSQPAIGRFVEQYKRLTADGSTVLSLHLTESLSGTVNTARQAAAMVDGDVIVVDTQMADRAMAFQVLTAVRMAHGGADLPSILAKLTKIREQTRIYLYVDSLTNLAKGGRIPKVAGVLTNMINLKFVFELRQGKLHLAGRGRGKKGQTKLNQLMLADLEKANWVEEVGVSYVGDTDVVEPVKAQLAPLVGQATPVIAPTSPIIATHTGMGAYAVMYYFE